jgi:hypothetical protein
MATRLFMRPHDERQHYPDAFTRPGNNFPTLEHAT